MTYTKDEAMTEGEAPMTTTEQPVEVRAIRGDALTALCNEAVTLAHGSKTGDIVWQAAYHAAMLVQERLASTAAPVGLAEAAEALVAKLDSIDFASIGVEAWARGREYSGPTFGEELEALRAALSQQEAEPRVEGVEAAFREGFEVRGIGERQYLETSEDIDW